MAAPLVVIPPQLVEMLPNEAKYIAVDFVNYGFATGENLSGPAVVNLTLPPGSAGTEIVVSAATISGTQVIFNVAFTGALQGNIYKLDIVCPTSVALNKAEGTFELIIKRVG